MKNRLLSIILICLIVFIPNATVASDYKKIVEAFAERIDWSNAISINVTIDKKIYSVGESVELDVRFTNNSDGYLYFSTRFAARKYLTLMITDEAGKVIPYIGRVTKVKPISYSSFMPINGRSYIGRYIDLVNGNYNYDLKEKGKYIVTGFYVNNSKEELIELIQEKIIEEDTHFPVPFIWKGRLDFPELRFEIR